MTTLTNDQITAGAAVLCDHGQPIGRNAAITVFDAMCAPSPQIAEKVELARQIVQDTNDTLREQAATMLALKAENDQLRDAIAASRRAELTYTVDGVVMSPLEYIDYLHDKIATPAPASAGQAAPPLPAAHRATIEEAAQVLESAAAHNRAKGRTVLERTQQDRADRLRLILAAQPAEASAGQAGQVATGDKPFAYVFKSTMKMLRDGCSVMGEIHPEVEPGTDLFEPIYAAPVEQGAAPSEKAAAANAGNQPPVWYVARSVDGKQHDTGRVERVHGGLLASTYSVAEAQFIADALNWATANRTPAADAGGLAPGWKLERVGEAIHITRPDGRWCGYMQEVDSPAHKLTHEFLDALLTSRAAATSAGEQGGAA